MEPLFITRVPTPELWIELAKRFGIRFGKIQMAIHEGKPSKYAQVDMKISTDGKKEPEGSPV